MSSEQLMVLALLVVPLVAAVVIWLLGPARGGLVRQVSLVTSLVVLALAVALTAAYLGHERPAGGPSAVATFVPSFVPGAVDDEPGKTTWDVFPLGPGAVQFYLGVDGLNVWLVLLTALLLPPCVLISFPQIKEREHEYYAWLMLLNTCMFGIFLSFDIMLFYVFFEVSLVPLFFLIGIWGGVDRQFAARKFVLYTLAGSMLTLLGMLTVILSAYYCSHWQPEKRVLTFSIPELVRQVNTQLTGSAAAYVQAGEDAGRAAEWARYTRDYWLGVQLWVFLALSAGFAIKVPLLPFHTWLPLAHTEAPTAGSVILAGVLLKIGCYGFLRMVVPLTPDVSVRVGVPLITWLSAIGIVYGAFTAFAQEDFKKLIAYSSVSHLGVVMLGMFSLTVVGLQGSVVQMINHGLSTPLLFLLIGMLYERYHTRKLGDYSGMAAKLPYLAIFLVFSCLSSAGLPGLNGFVGEVLCLAGIFSNQITDDSARWALTALGASGMVLGAWYLFTMARHLLFGPLKEPAHDGHAVPDLNAREWALLVPLVLVCVALGVYPQPVLRTSEPDVRIVASFVDQARERGETARRAAR